jgi:hypothetical protein
MRDNAEYVKSASVGTTVWFWVCPCCHQCGDQALLAHANVTCRYCGHRCSCLGCVAESDG